MQLIMIVAVFVNLLFARRYLREVLDGRPGPGSLFYAMLHTVIMMVCCAELLWWWSGR